jgi:6-phosphogluconolactonase
MSEVLVYPTLALASRSLCDRMVRISETAMAVRDRFIVALAGGSTPRMAYEMLSGEYARYMDWESSYIFWGDERGVPPESLLSNTRMVREALINHVRIPLDRVFRIKGELPAAEAAEQYENQLRQFFERREMRTPRFDALLLGLGADGHIASLLPGSPALTEQRRWVSTAQRADEPFARITLTFPAINSAAHILILVSGADKASVVARAIKGDRSQGTLPAHGLAPAAGDVVWILDEAAAKEL